MRLRKKIETFYRSSPKIILCLVANVVLTMLITVPVRSQAIYSDVWIDDSNVTEEGGQAYIVGRGVSEINYVDEDGLEVETTLITPNGLQISSTSFGFISAQADARFPWNWDLAGDFTVRAQRFPMCSIDGWTTEEGPLIIHGYNGNAGNLWWRPTGFQRCLRNSSLTLRIVPVGLSMIALQRTEWRLIPPFARFVRVEPCGVRCNHVVRSYATLRLDEIQRECLHFPCGFVDIAGTLVCVRAARPVPAIYCLCFEVSYG
jgi:hypothetical protein